MGNRNYSTGLGHVYDYWVSGPLGIVSFASKRLSCCVEDGRVGKGSKSKESGKGSLGLQDLNSPKQKTSIQRQILSSTSMMVMKLRLEMSPQ